MTDSSSILGAIQHYQRSIERSQTQSDETRLLHCINKLYKMPVKVEHLQETGIGKTVNSLRKFNGEIGVAAKALVTKWKAMVAAEEEKEPVQVNGQSTEDDDNMNEESDDSSSDEQQPTQRRCSTSRDSPQKAQTQPHDDDDRSERKQSSHKTRKRKNSGSSDEAAATVRPSRSHKLEKRDTKEHHRRRRSGEREGKAEPSQRSKEKHSHSEQHGSREHRKHKTDGEREAGERKKSPTTSHHKSSSSQRKVESRHSKHRHHTSKERSESNQEKTAVRHKEQQPSKDNNSKHERSDETNEKPTTSAEHRDKSKSTSTPRATSERKRHHNSDNDSAAGGDVKSPEIKVGKVTKSAKKESAAKADEPEDGIDSSMGANFADVLGMLNMPAKKSKKSLQTLSTAASTSSSAKSAGNSGISRDTSLTKSSSHTNGVKSSTATASRSRRSPSAKPDLLSSTAKLAPLDPSIALELPTISNNYKPMPLNQTVMDCVFNTSTSSASKVAVRTLTDAEALSHGISSKTMRTKIYSGVRTGQIIQVPSLFDLCIRVLQKNIDALEYTGGVPFEVLRPVLERASPQQLLIFEEYNPYLMEDSDILWQLHVGRNYRSQKRQEMETWREMFLRCQDDQERKLNILAESIKQSQKIIAAPVRKTQLAFVDSMVKPPRNVQRKQEQFGTKGKLAATPAARVAALSSVTPNAVKPGDVRLRVAAGVRDAAQVAHGAIRPKKAPLMAKTLQLMRGRHKR